MSDTSRRKNRQTLVAAVAYIRMSTDQQEDSPERQRAEILKIAKAGGYQIIRWYEDHGLTGTKSKNRPQFQELLKDAEAGEFRAVLMYEQSRFSRETMLQFASHLNHLHAADVDLVTRKGKISPDDIGGFLTAMIDQHGARQESENISHRTASGKRQKVLATKTWMGAPPFGFDREILDSRSQPVFRVPYHEEYVRSRSQTARLVPSPELARHVQDVFQGFTEGLSIRQLTIRLNETGFRTKAGRKWSHSSVMGILRNPAYYGALVVARSPYEKGRSQFNRMFEEPTVIDEQAHEGLVTKDVFDAVQNTLESRKGRRVTGIDQPYLLSGLLVCGHCGARIYGRPGVNGSGKARFYYACPIRSKDRSDRSCVSITGHMIESAVIGVIKRDVLSDDNLLANEAAFLAERSEAPLNTERLAVELRKKIASAEANLALAEDPSDFAAISKMLREWRKELSKLSTIKKPASPRYKSAGMERLKAARDNLENAARGPLADAISQTIDSIILQRTSPGTHKTAAQIVFRPDWYRGGDVTITPEQLNVRSNNRRQQFAEFVKKQGRPVAFETVRNHFGLSVRMCKFYLSQAATSGTLIRPENGWDGWVSK